MVMLSGHYLLMSAMPRLLGVSAAASLVAAVLIRLCFRPRSHYLEVRRLRQAAPR